MPDRKWFPADWLDEVNPGLLETPDGFIEREGNGWALRLPQDEPERDNEFYRLPVEPGQIVKFMSLDSYGYLRLIVHPDGSWETDAPPPPEARSFSIAFDIIADSIDELVVGDEFSLALDPGEYEVAAYTWSDAIPFRFELVGSDRGHFVPCVGAN